MTVSSKQKNKKKTWMPNHFQNIIKTTKWNVSQSHETAQIIIQPDLFSKLLEVDKIDDLLKEKASLGVKR